MTTDLPKGWMRCVSGIACKRNMIPEGSMSPEKDVCTVCYRVLHPAPEVPKDEQTAVHTLKVGHLLALVSLVSVLTSCTAKAEQIPPPGWDTPPQAPVFVQLPPTSRIMQKGDTFHVLLMDRRGAEFLECQWQPTPLGYSEDARCQLKR